MNILITGAAGHLGGHLMAIQPAEFRVTGLDRVLPSAPSDRPFVQADLSKGEGIREALEGAGLLDVVVHCASIHPWKSYTDDQYLDANVKGTWHLYAALAVAGIKKVVLTSSIAANGYHVPPEAWPATEDQEFPLGDIYSLTKRFQEDIARFYARNHGIQTVALRPPAFMPVSQKETGLALLGSFCLVSDIVEAHQAALRALAAQGPNAPVLQPFEACFVTNQLPYDERDFALYRETPDLGPLVLRHFPEAYAWFRSERPAASLAAVYRLEKARRLLGWTPKFNFEQWWELHGSAAPVA